ncbi:MAG TPA: hypothetical protein VNQ76_08860 [Planctomicrobium sp.]|nr:hypothetical protein [Planctomicrobium sp.]
MQEIDGTGKIARSALVYPMVQLFGETSRDRPQGRSREASLYLSGTSLNPEVARNQFESVLHVERGILVSRLRNHSSYGYSTPMAIRSKDFIDQQIRVGHAQTSTIGKFREDLPGLQLVAMNFCKNPGIISLIQHDGTLLQQEEPCHSGSPMLPVNWRGDGTEFILLSGNVHEGGLLNGRLQRVVMFPDDGHPDLCAAAMNVTGDPRDEILLWDQNRVWIYTQGEPFSGNRIYAPRRNPPENDSNYRCNVSWSAWQSMSTNVPE